MAGSNIFKKVTKKMGIAIGIGYAHFEKSYYVAACFCVSNSIISLHHFGVGVCGDI